MSERVPLSTSGTAPSWLLKEKVSTPELGTGHVPRAALLPRLGAALERRFVLLQAPAGFGKTTVLADFSRRKSEEGLVVAWVSLDEGDVPSVFGGYLACAFERGGLDLLALGDAEARPSSPETYQVGMLACAVKLHEAPCLLVLDEVDRLPRETVELIQRLVEHGPGNLHFALAFRSDPGLDLSIQVLDGAGVVFGAEELRFSRSEIRQFFGDTLSRRRLSAAEEQTAGWPVALTAYRNQRAAGTPPRGVGTARLMADFVRSRLLGSLSVADRTFVCELAVFDRVDAELVDEVLGLSGSEMRIASLRELDGLLTPIGPDGAVRRLHPLVREPCVAVLASEDPVRKRALHAAIAEALARRGQLVPAWRQARAAPDARLAGELVERAGVFDLWLRHGVAALFAASEFLTPEITVSRPRLVLLRVVVLRMMLKVDEAAALYESVRRETKGLTRDRDGSDTEALAVDRVFAGWCWREAPSSRCAMSWTRSCRRPALSTAMSRRGCGSARGTWSCAARRSSGRVSMSATGTRRGRASCSARKGHTATSSSTSTRAWRRWPGDTRTKPADVTRARDGAHSGTLPPTLACRCASKR